MSAAVPSPTAEAPALPRQTWILLGLAAALAALSAVASYHSPDRRALVVAVSCAATGALCAWRAYRLALRSHARAALIASGLLLGFLATPVAVAAALALMVLARGL